MAYKRERNYTLEKERDLSLTIAPEGTPLPDRVCGGCAHYRAGGYCEERRKDVGYLWTACAQFTTETPKPQDTMETEKKTPTTKVCKKCGRELPTEAFNRHAKSRDGLQPYCRECQRETAKAGAAKKDTKQVEPHYTKRNALFDKCVENCDPKVMKEVSDKVDEMLGKEQKPVEIRIDNPNIQKLDPDVVVETRTDGTGDIDGKALLYTAANPSVTEIPNHDLAQELRRRGYDVKCSKTIEL